MHNIYPIPSVLLKMIRIIRIFLLLASACCTIPVTAASLNIICTTKPACLLLKAITGEPTTHRQLLPDNADPHHYNLRPSDLRKLSQANVVVRLSPALEIFLKPILDSGQYMVINLADTPQLTHHLLATQHNHQHGQTFAPHLSMLPSVSNQTTARQTKERPNDPHFWLNPQNASKMAYYLAHELAKINPTQAERYQQNSQLLIKQIQHSDQRIRQLLNTDRRKPYLAFHTGLQYFAKYYQLASPEIVSLHEGLPVGIKTIRHLRTILQQTHIPCLIAEPRASTALIQTLTADINMNIASLDPMGSTLPKTRQSYPRLLEHIAETLHTCLKNSQNNS